jgi:excisionase family DNA binding protein
MIFNCYCVIGGLLTTKQAAERLGIKRSSLHSLIQRGRIKAERIGDSRELFIEETEVVKYQENRRKPGKPKGTKKAAATSL